LPAVDLAHVDLAGGENAQKASLRTTNVFERLHEEFKRRIKTQTVLPSADTATCITSGDTPLNCLIGNEPQHTSSVVLGMGFDNTPEGKLVPKFQTGRGPFPQRVHSPKRR
jgi:hypothetical protein